MIKEYIWNKKKINMNQLLFDIEATTDEKIMRTFIKNEQINRKKRGLLLADIKYSEAEGIPNLVSIGFSLCNKKDKYDDALAHKIARNRLRKNYQKDFISIPQSIQKQLKRFIKRCEKYYKIDGINIIFPLWINGFMFRYDNWNEDPDYFPPDQPE